ncbi:mycothiol transferase [Nocardioides nitrophenolicus]|uniref:mycothiol transferase n=1 Tax=Nocardioides nitrophenolicus TaxID=60489 RepID=UPI00195B63BB|nr:DUF664 domain-containing protein [Nocardioides nitrophenolicus]MBM7520360.1 putative damage-inducible protein DinB [Nocardioides nitrophenolicus]
MTTPERWTAATVHPDMWLDAAEDPREREGPPAAGERATLEEYLHDYRLTLRLKCDGLDPGQLARRSVPPSTMSLLGLVRHLAEVERDWRNWITTGPELPGLYGEPDGDFDGAVGEAAVVDAAWADLAREQEATDAILTAFLDTGADPSAALGRSQVVVRDLMVHRIEEYARHCGHADLLRECVDGRVGQ